MTRRLKRLSPVGPTVRIRTVASDAAGVSDRDSTADAPATGPADYVLT